MEELYLTIEEKIKSSGYKRIVSGCDIYEELCDFVEEKENGSYVFFSKKEETVTFEYHLTVMEQEFNLSLLLITVPEGTYSIPFDE